MRKKELLFVALLCMTTLVYAQTPKLTLSSFKIDEKIRNLPDSLLKLVKIYPEKLFLHQGEPVKGVVDLFNSGDKNATVELRVWLTNDLDTAVGAKKMQVSVNPGELKHIAVDWPAKVLKPYGHALKVEVLHKGKEIASGEEYFVTADNVWEVGLAGGHPVGFTAEHVKTKEQVAAAVDRFRQKYVNTYEKFFWAPDDFGDMTPDKDVWYSGQARYHERKDFLKYMADYGRKIGVLPTTYGKSIGSGPAARDIIRRNPEMIWGFGGRMDFHPDTEELSKWDKDSKPYWQATAWANYNMNDPAVVAKGIDEIIKSTEMFGWAGVRFDGHFQARTGKRNVGGKKVDFTPEMADRQTADNMRVLKERVRRKFPRYVFGYNFAECAFAEKLQEHPRESIELCKDGGHIMDEYAKQCAGGSHPCRKWSDFADMLVEESIIVRRLGGYLFPMCHSNGVIGRYQAIFILAAEAHTNSTPWATDHKYGMFATRYAGILWDKRLKNIWHPDGLVLIAPSVMWKNYVRTLDIDSNHRQLIIHLINPPRQETATESAALENEIRKRKTMRRDIIKAAGAKKIKPDFSKLDSLPPIKLFPDPQKNVNVKIVPQAMDFKWDISKATLLNADDVSRQSLKIDKSDPYFWQVTVPELKGWSVLIVDLQRKGE